MNVTLVITLLVAVATIPVIAWLGRRSGERAMERLGPFTEGAVQVVAFVAGPTVKAIRRLAPEVPRISPLLDRFRGRVLIAVIDRRELAVWRSGKAPQQLLRVPLSRLEGADANGGFNMATHLALHVDDLAGGTVTIPLLAHGATGVVGRPTLGHLRTTAAAITALRATYDGGVSGSAEGAGGKD